jgi:hypothetical protein
MIDLTDQLVDALGDVLPTLIRVTEIAFQRLDALQLRGELLAQCAVLVAQALRRVDQRADRALQAIEVVRRVRPGGLETRIGDDLGNDAPRRGIVPVPKESRQRKARLFDRSRSISNVG